MNNVLTWLEKSAANTPTKLAIRDPENSLTYAELESYARRIGSVFAELSFSREGIAFYLDKSSLALAGMLGAVYAGCFYSVLDTRQPKARINSILTTLRPALVVTDALHRPALEEILDDTTYEIRLLDELAQSEANEALLAKRRAHATDTDPLYVNFTSGSTGTPKGVVVGHRSVIDFIPNFTKTFDINSSDIIANQAPFDFDVSVKDIYSALCVGATIAVVPRDYFSAPTTLMDYLLETRATTLIWAVSAMCFVSIMNGFEYRVPSDVRQVIFSGEVMPPKQLRVWQHALPHARFVNVYGPTEITCNCTYFVVDREYENDEIIPMGKAFENERVLLLDENDTLIEEPGRVGELCVSGTTLGFGYLDDLERSSATFVQNPTNTRWLELMYRTGDLAKYNELGDLIYVSRKDFQVKHMGQRIELGEIEMSAQAIEGVEQSACLYDEKRKKLKLFYVGATPREEVSRELHERLPQYMVPGKIAQLDMMPLTKNGKIDRAQLATL